VVFFHAQNELKELLWKLANFKAFFG